MALVLRGRMVTAAQPASAAAPRWPLDQPYVVQEDPAAARLTLSNPYYTIQHDLRRGGVVTAIRLSYGRAANLLVRPVEAVARNEAGTLFSDAYDPAPQVRRRREGATEIVAVETVLRDATGASAGVRLRTVIEYRWGYLKIRREFSSPESTFRALELSPFATVLAPSLTEYGYREGTTEDEGAPAFAFGSNKWGRLRAGVSGDPPLAIRFLPRSMLFADPGVEGIEWFVGSDLAQWDLQLTGRRGQGLCSLRPSMPTPGLMLTLAAYHSTNAPLALPKTCTFDFRLGLPLRDDHPPRPWLHTSFNRNRGAWVSSDQIRQWATNGIQTVHCHNDGDYYDDGLFWRDGAYPPYPDMNKYNAVIDESHRAGVRVATYFSNKELHPATLEYQTHSADWARLDRKGNIQHNFFRGTNEFGAQMCLRSGWLDGLKLSIDRVLTNHPLDGVYYDWNVALLCWNRQHGPAGGATSATNAGGVTPTVNAAPHWDIDELLDLMEWTRRRVGPNGLVIIHNTTTPMFVTENFADHIVANEWGYGKWQEPGPALTDLPLEWSLVGARSRGVISYGQLDGQSPRRLHRLFALGALLGGVTPWPASAETFDLVPMLEPIGDFRTCRFADWRNSAVRIDGRRCGSAVYSRPNEAYVLLANLDKEAQEVNCVIRPDRLPHPMPRFTSATVLRRNPEVASNVGGNTSTGLSMNTLDAAALAGTGVRVALPPDGALLIRVR
jgi:hypothetical protein